MVGIPPIETVVEEVERVVLFDSWAEVLKTMVNCKPEEVDLNQVVLPIWTVPVVGLLSIVMGVSRSEPMT